MGDAKRADASPPVVADEPSSPLAQHGLAVEDNRPLATIAVQPSSIQRSGRSPETKSPASSVRMIGLQVKGAICEAGAVTSAPARINDDANAALGSFRPGPGDLASGAGTAYRARFRAGTGGNFG